MCDKNSGKTKNLKEILNSKPQGWSEVTFAYEIKGHSGTQNKQLWETQHGAPATLSQCRFVIMWDKKMSEGLEHVLTK